MKASAWDQNETCGNLAKALKALRAGSLACSLDSLECVLSDSWRVCNCFIWQCVGDFMGERETLLYSQISRYRPVVEVYDLGLFVLNLDDKPTFARHEATVGKQRPELNRVNFPRPGKREKVNLHACPHIRSLAGRRKRPVHMTLAPRHLFAGVSVQPDCVTLFTAHGGPSTDPLGMAHDNVVRVPGQLRGDSELSTDSPTWYAGSEQDFLSGGISGTRDADENHLGPMAVS